MNKYLVFIISIMVISSFGCKKSEIAMIQNKEVPKSVTITPINTIAEIKPVAPSNATPSDKTIAVKPNEKANFSHQVKVVDKPKADNKPVAKAENKPSPVKRHWYFLWLK